MIPGCGGEHEVIEGSKKGSTIGVENAPFRYESREYASKFMSNVPDISDWFSKNSDRGDDWDDEVDEDPGDTRAGIAESAECGEIGVVELKGEKVGGNSRGLLVKESGKRLDVDELTLPADEDAETESFRLEEANFLFREASGSLMKMHSRPREVHFEHGY